MGKSGLFWIVAVGFFAGILLGQQYLVRQGSDLLPGSGGDFTLQSSQGPVSLNQFKGKVVAVYFGYMACPDICPTSLWNLSQGLKLLTAEQQAQIKGIFISVDYERDTPQALEIFSQGFHPNIIGLTGTSREQVDKVARQYGAIYEKVALEDSAMGYVIDHSSIIYLLDREGIVRYRVPHAESPEAIAQYLRELLEQR